jgi:hypothetical protein
MKLRVLPSELPAIELSNNAGSGRSPELHHDQMEKGFHRMRANVHLLGYFFAGETFHH